ncbi:DUF3226 domain-containing protein [Agathobaculum sp.]|uniref:DUF3226 domain-containing protein n=1 Tax=Agathobaculum sp. TaxID=2048138 RepID=UPI003520D6AE
MGKESKKRSIVQPHLILCEGADEWNFLIRLLNHWIPEDAAFNTIQVIDFGGNDELKNFLETLPLLPNYEIVRSILIIRDAEQDYHAAIQSIKSSLKNNCFPVPDTVHQIIQGDRLKIAYSLFPTCSDAPQNGTLEDLAYSLLRNTDYPTAHLTEVNKFLEKIESLNNKKFARRHKNKLHTCFSINDDYVTLKIGEAALAGAFDFSSTLLSPLKKLIFNLVSE